MVMGPATVASRGLPPANAREAALRVSGRAVATCRGRAVAAFRAAQLTAGD